MATLPREIAMKHRAPHKDWHRCTECGKFTDTTKVGCADCGDVEQKRVGGWSS